MSIDLENFATGGQVVLPVLAGLGLIFLRICGPGRRQRLIWKFKVSAASLPKIIIEPVPSLTTNLYTRPSTGYGSVVAVAQLTHALNASRPGFFRRTVRSLEDPIEICFSSDRLAMDWMRHGDTVLVGGPKHNGITGEVLTRYGCQPNGAGPVTDAELCTRTGVFRPTDGVATGLGVATVENAIYFFGEARQGTVTDRDPADGDKQIGFTGTDIGVVLRVPSLLNPRHRMIVVFGSQTFGTQAAASWLVNAQSRSTSRETRTMMRKYGNIAALVTVEVNDGIAGRPELIEMVPLPNPLSRERP